MAAYDLDGYVNGDGGPRRPTSRASGPSSSLPCPLGADVVSLTGVENDDTHAGYAAIEDLVDGLNAATGAGTYAFVDSGC